MAGLTVTRIYGPVARGDRWETVSEVDFDDSYLSGGESLTPAMLGFASTVDDEFDVEIRPTGGYVFSYNYTDQLVHAWWVDTTTDGAPLAQVPSTTDINDLALAVRVKATGKYRS